MPTSFPMNNYLQKVKITFIVWIPEIPGLNPIEYIDGCELKEDRCLCLVRQIRLSLIDRPRRERCLKMVKTISIGYRLFFNEKGYTTINFRDGTNNSDHVMYFTFCLQTKTNKIKVVYLE